MSETRDALLRLREAKRVLQLRIQGLIANELEDFSKKYGIYPTSIHIDLIDVTTLGSDDKETIIGQVEVRFEL